MFNKELNNFLNNLGVSFWGISKYENSDNFNLEKMPFVLTLGIRLLDTVIDEISDKPTYTYFNHYRTVNSFLDQSALRTAMFIQEKGFSAHTIAASQSIPDSKVPYSGVFSHKTGAVLSGLGWIGKNGLFIHRNFGPRVRLVTIFTDMPFELIGGNNTDFILSETEAGLDEMKLIKDNQELCKNCNECVKACPAMAIKGKIWRPGVLRDEIIDPRACSEYMNKHFKHIGRGSVCGICIKVCRACI